MRIGGINRKGVMGPQALESIPIAIMAFIVSVAAIIIYLDITSAHLTETKLADMYNTGKRLVETLSGDAFQSDISRSYGVGILDSGLIQRLYAEDPTLKNVIGSIEYGYRAEVQAGRGSWVFGEDGPAQTLIYSGAVTVLFGESLHNGRITVKIWSK